MKISTLWLSDYVRLKKSLEEVAERLTMAGLEVKGIHPSPNREGLIFETEITSNRPDWLSYLGVAREISALYGSAVKVPEIIEPKKLLPFPQDFNIEIQDTDLCPYYTGTILKGIKPCPTPDFIKKRLDVMGMRSINFIVDVTNFVLMECGQPLHAFDLNLLQGNEVLIRKAQAGEIITGIDEKRYDLSPKDLVIADKNRPIAIAGLMGGKETEVNGETQDILLESAFFKPSKVRDMSKRMVLSSDSSYRFERRVDPEGVNWARERVITLLTKYTEVGEVTRVKAVGRKPIRKKTVLLTFEKMTSVLGSSVPPAHVEKIFKNLGFSIASKNKKAIKVSVPSFRSDVALAEDLVEEVARIYGYDQIPETLPSLDIIPDTLPPKRKFQIIHQISDQLVGAGFWEAQNFSLVRGEVYEKLLPDTYQLLRVVNPQHKELNLMRPDLISGLVETAQRNQARGSKYFKFFEVGQIYHAKGKELPEEKVSVGFIAYGKPSKEWSNDPRAISLYDAKGAVENLMEQLGLDKYEWQGGSYPWLEEGCSIILSARGNTIGALGELKSEALNTFNLEGPVIVGELDLETIIPWVSSERSFQAFSKYPSTTRDLSLMVPQELPVESVRSTILSEGNDWLRDVRLFDIYEGKNIPQGVKSLAFSLEYQSLERTLGSEEVQTEHARIAKVLQDKYNAQLPPATRT